MLLTRAGLVARLAERTALNPSDVDRVIDALQDVLVGALSTGTSVRVHGLLAVERTQRAARTGRNPRTGEPIDIAAGYGVKVTAGSSLKRAVRSSAMHPEPAARGWAPAPRGRRVHGSERTGDR